MENKYDNTAKLYDNTATRYDNTLACQKYHQKHKGQPEYKLRKLLQARRQYYKQRYLRFRKLFPLGIYPKLLTTTKALLFHVWKDAIPNNAQNKPKPLTNKQTQRKRLAKLKKFVALQQRKMLKAAIDSWKRNEKTQV